MLHSAIGQLEQIDGEDYLITNEGDEGYVLFGPYEVLDPGSYQVEFFAMPGEIDGSTCCVVDILRRGRTVAAEKDFTAADLIQRNGLIQLRFEVIARDSYEYRLMATGSSALRVRYHRPIRRLPDLDVAPT
ncbi:hypothetical protein LGH83_08505 [Lichenihabitans sp. PAMC28606]|uniref:hypothetical protein n=1 Tax=Lichenihabitans TaxID=2723776 RepID=UPI001038577D|nr:MULTISPECIES: hypothetical protein [Lichenihabitans]UDL96205.1 hypothetical protein LGH83_08505 [Lichenihabitans sp. PAMC28606]